MEQDNSTMTFAEFKDDWLLKHPASIPIEEIEDSPYPRWLRGATLIMFLAAALLSAVHTIPVVYDNIPNHIAISQSVRTTAANASIIAFELGILLSAFLMITKSSMVLAWVLLGTMFAGTVVANIQSISKTSGAGGGAVIVTLIFGAGIPVIALAAGKLFVNIYAAERALKKRSKDNYKEAMRALDATINAAYSKHANKGDQRSNLIKNNQISPRNKPSPRLQKALTWLEKNPGNLDTPPRELERKVGVSYGTIYSAQKLLKDVQNGYTNGHGDIEQ